MPAATTEMLLGGPPGGRGDTSRAPWQKGQGPPTQVPGSAPPACSLCLISKTEVPPPQRASTKRKENTVCEKLHKIEANDLLQDVLV